jgi:hypothetical protein
MKTTLLITSLAVAGLLLATAPARATGKDAKKSKDAAGCCAEMTKASGKSGSECEGSAGVTKTASKAKAKEGCGTSTGSAKAAKTGGSGCCADGGAMVKAGAAPAGEAKAVTAKDKK